jgi:hypothetical protein
MSRSTVENQDATWLYLRAPTAKPLRVADPRSLPRGQIKTLPAAPPTGEAFGFILYLCREVHDSRRIAAAKAVAGL